MDRRIRAPLFPLHKTEHRLPHRGHPGGIGSPEIGGVMARASRRRVAAVIMLVMAATAVCMQCGSNRGYHQSSTRTEDVTVQLARLLLDTTLLRQASAHVVNDTLHIVLPGTRAYEIKDRSRRTRPYENTPLEFTVEKVELTAPECTRQGLHR